MLQDDMQGLLEQTQRSQVWVLGTPVYYWGPTAQFKAFVERISIIVVGDVSQGRHDTTAPRSDPPGQKSDDDPRQVRQQ